MKKEQVALVRILFFFERCKSDLVKEQLLMLVLL